MEAISSQVEPKIGSDGAKYRRKQMMYQLPIHDHDENYCDNLTEPEKASMRQFCEDRNQNALGVGDVREKNNPVSKWVSELFTTRTRRSTVVRRLYFVLQPAKPLISLKKKTKQNKQTKREGRHSRLVLALVHKRSRVRSRDFTSLFRLLSFQCNFSSKFKYLQKGALMQEGGGGGGGIK